MTPDNIDPIIAIPLAIALWVIVYLQHKKAKRDGQ